MHRLQDVEEGEAEEEVDDDVSDVGGIVHTPGSLCNNGHGGQYQVGGSSGFGPHRVSHYGGGDAMDQAEQRYAGKHTRA